MATRKQQSAHCVRRRMRRVEAAGAESVKGDNWPYSECGMPGTKGSSYWVFGVEEEGDGVRSGPGVTRTILLFHIISARPSKQTRMVCMFLMVYGDWILFFVSARTNKRHHFIVHIFCINETTHSTLEPARTPTPFNPWSKA